MPKKKITEIVRTLPQPKLSKASRPRPSSPASSPPIIAAATPVKEPVTENVGPVKAAFENKAGKYELIRVNGDQAFYSFTNHLERTVDATMSVLMWQRMQARADATLKETA